MGEVRVELLGEDLAGLLERLRVCGGRARQAHGGVSLRAGEKPLDRGAVRLVL
jgi:hypothetical protein